MRIHSLVLMAVPFLGVFFAIMPLVEAAWDSINVEADDTEFTVSYRTGSKKPYRVIFMYVCMYVCMVITYSRIWINRVRLPILLVVS